MWASCSSSLQKRPLPSPLLSFGRSALQLSAFLSCQLSHRTHDNLMLPWLQLHIPHSPALSRLLSASGIISQWGQCACWWPQCSQRRAHGSAEAASPQRCQAEAAPLGQSHCHPGVRHTTLRHYFTADDPPSPKELIWNCGFRKP